MLRSIALLLVFSLAALNNVAHGDATLRESTLFIYSFQYDEDETFTVDVSNNHVVISHSSGRRYDEFSLPAVQKIVFRGDADRDHFTNNTLIPSDQYGGDGNDTLVGGKGEDFLWGEWGEDYLFGRQGSDTLVLGIDLVEGCAIGGQGSDLIIFSVFYGESERRNKGVDETVRLTVDQVILGGHDFNRAQSDTMWTDRIFMDDLPYYAQFDLLEAVIELQARGIL